MNLGLSFPLSKLGSSPNSHQSRTLPKRIAFTTNSFTMLNIHLTLAITLVFIPLFCNSQQTFKIHADSQKRAWVHSVFEYNEFISRDPNFKVAFTHGIIYLFAICKSFSLAKHQQSIYCQNRSTYFSILVEACYGQHLNWLVCY